jgi:hypothetical protein
MLSNCDKFLEFITKGQEFTASDSIGGISDYQLLINSFYRCYTDIHQITMFKIFLDATWSDLWEYYFNLTDTFKSLCEKNNQSSKKFFGKLRFAVKNQFYEPQKTFGETAFGQIVLGTPGDKQGESEIQIEDRRGAVFARGRLVSKDTITKWNSSQKY